jgi:hypothetical protein
MQAGSSGAGPGAGGGKGSLDAVLAILRALVNTGQLR